MIFSQSFKRNNTLVDDIDIENNSYKITKYIANNDLLLSMKSIGLIEPPVLLKLENSKYIIIFGHNRINILSELNIKNVESIILEKLPVKFYFNYIFLKNYRGEISVAGKIKLIQIMSDNFNLNHNEIALIMNNLKVPLTFWKNENLPARFNALPRPLKMYIDVKDIGFKVVRNMLRLPMETMPVLSSWVNEVNMRVNIFRKIVDLILDIYKRDKTTLKLEQIDVSLREERRDKEEYLFKEIFKIRYPEYSIMKADVAMIIDNFRKEGIEISFPEYFEGDEIGINIKLNKKENFDYCKNRLSKINIEEVKKLFDFL